jgi:hypothetical protein
MSNIKVVPVLDPTPTPWAPWFDVYTDLHRAEALVGGQACYLASRGESLDASRTLARLLDWYLRVRVAYDAHPATVAARVAAS